MNIFEFEWFRVHYIWLLFSQMPTLLTGEPLDSGKKARMEEALGFFDVMLKGRTWAAVNHFTIADLALTITVSQIEAYGFDLMPYTRVTTWLQRCKDFLTQHGYEVRKEFEFMERSRCTYTFVLTPKFYCFTFELINRREEGNWRRREQINKESVWPRWGNRVHAFSPKTHSYPIEPDRSMSLRHSHRYSGDVMPWQFIWRRFAWITKRHAKEIVLH